jgi:hypothetical protein
VHNSGASTVEKQPRLLGLIPGYLTKGEPGPLGFTYTQWALMLIILSICIVGLVLSFRRHPKKPGSQ